MPVPELLLEKTEDIVVTTSQFRFCLFLASSFIPVFQKQSPVNFLRKSLFLRDKNYNAFWEKVNFKGLCLPVITLGMSWAGFTLRQHGGVLKARWKMGRSVGHYSGRKALKKYRI